jgi:hypothetical protein
LRAEKPPPVKHPRLLNNTGNKALRSILFFWSPIFLFQWFFILRRTCSRTLLN